MAEFFFLLDNKRICARYTVYKETALFTVAIFNQDAGPEALEVVNPVGAGMSITPTKDNARKVVNRFYIPKHTKNV